MTFAAVGTLIQSANSSTFTLTPGGVGDLILIEVVAIDGTFLAKSLTSTNVKWAPVATFTGTNNSWGAALFQGTVTAASAATVTIAWVGGTSANFRVAGQEFSSTVGFWALDAEVTLDSLFGTSTWPAITPTGAGELCFGYVINQNSAIAGSTTGFTYEIDAHSNGLAYNANCTAAAQQVVWGDSSQALGIIVMFREVVYSITTLNSDANSNNTQLTPDHLYKTNVDAFSSSSAPFTAQVQWANSESDWGATISITSAGNQVYTYPDQERDYDQLPLANVSNIICTYAETMPQASSGFIGEALFDCWLNGAAAGFGVEIGIFVDNQGVSLAGDTLLGSGLKFPGNPLTWSIYQRPGAMPPDFIWVPTVNTPSMTFDMLPMFNWLATNGYITSPATIQAIEFGWEAITTAGVPMTFRCTQFTLSTGLEAGPIFTQKSGIFETTGTSLALNTQGIGDIVLLAVITESATVWATSVSGGNCTWQILVAPFTGASEAFSVTMFLGTVTALGAATATITYNGATPTVRGVAMEFATSAGWVLDASGHIDTSTGTATFPSLTATQPGELYFGYAFNGSSGAGGTSPGVVYGQDSHSNNWLFRTGTPQGPEAPVTGDSTNLLGVAVLLRASPNIFTPQGLSSFAGAGGDRTAGLWEQARTGQWQPTPGFGAIGPALVPLLGATRRTLPARGQILIPAAVRATDTELDWSPPEPPPEPPGEPAGEILRRAGSDLAGTVRAIARATGSTLYEVGRIFAEGARPPGTRH